MSINNVSTASIEQTPTQVASFNRHVEVKQVENEGRAHRLSNEQSNAQTQDQSIGVPRAAEEKAQELRFNADKLNDVKFEDEVKAGAQAQKQQPGNAQLQKAIESTNGLSSFQVRKLEFSSSEESGRTIVKVVDKESDEVIRQIPSEDFIKVAKKINELSEELNSTQGLLFESKV